MEAKFSYTKFDIYSKRIGFYYKYHEKIGSIFGLFLTSIYIGASLILFFYQIIKTIGRSGLKTYDSTQYGQEMPSIEINSEKFYFAFGIEDPSTSTRFIDERIYYPKIVFIDKVKKGDQLVTVNSITLDYEKCDERKFGKNYQHLFVKNELNNSYCIKEPNFNLTLAGGYKYDRMTYIRIRIYPCVNSTQNNYTCRPKEVIDRYLASGFFSIVLKDIGFNPLNYSFPIQPILQDIYTTIDKAIMRNFILTFRISEIHTDKGLINEHLEKKKYLQYLKDQQTLTFRDEEEYYKGKSIILVQMKLDDAIFIQTRIYTKIPEIFSRIGGYMQLMNTIFLLLSLMINKINASLKIINSIFKFNIKENKMLIKFHPLNNPNLYLSSKNNNIFFSSSKSQSKKLKELENENKSKNCLILKDNGNNIPSILNASSNKKIKDLDKSKNFGPFNNSKDYSIKNGEETIYYNKDNHHNNFSLVEIEKKESNNLADNKEYYNLNVFDYIFCRKKYKNNKLIEFYKLGRNYYKKKMDIVNVFTLLSIIEKILAKKSNKKNI